MNVSAERRSSGRAAAYLVGRVVATTLLTAIVGAVENWLYELFVAPDLYAMGPPLARAAFMAAITAPFILVGLIALGLPSTLVLHRLKAENALSFGFAGAAFGTLSGLIIFPESGATGAALCAFYGCTCALIWWWLRPRA